jgi:hypothetical protein
VATKYMYLRSLQDITQSIIRVKGVTDLGIPVILVTRLLRRDLNRLVNGMEPVEPWDEG